VFDLIARRHAGGFQHLPVSSAARAAVGPSGTAILCVREQRRRASLFLSSGPATPSTSVGTNRGQDRCFSARWRQNDAAVFWRSDFAPKFWFSRPDPSGTPFPDTPAAQIKRACGVVSDERYVVRSRKLDIARIGDERGEFPAPFDIDGYVVLAMDDKRVLLQRFQDWR
jgi:hypothetical protein